MPFVRISSICPVACKKVLDAGACGIIFPMVNNLNDMINAYKYSLWPPKGNRGVAFNRANNYGSTFESYQQLASNPFLVAMIETSDGVKNISEIVQSGLLTILIGPYDLSGSWALQAS